jgi:osmotically-inducible protein OsmY
MRAARRPTDRPAQPLGPRGGGPSVVRALLLALTALAVITPAFPGDREAERRDADARQKLYVRRALSEDAGLTPYAGDIWVEVNGTTATLRGTLPSAMLKQRALFLAGQVQGIGDVRGDELQVELRDGTPDLPSPFPEGTPPHGTLAGNHREGHTTQAPRKPDVADSAESVRVSAPAPPAASSAPAPSGPLVEMLPPRPLPDPPDLSSTVEALRSKDERFRRVKVEVRQRTVFLRGAVARWDDVTDLANSVRRLPGVEAVILDSVRADR